MLYLSVLLRHHATLMKRSLLALLFAVLFPLAALAQPGTLDASFGEGGTVVLRPDSTAGANAVALAEGGKLVLAGTVDGDAAVLRLNVDGSLDESFGEDGYALLDFGGDADQFAGLAVQPSGALVVSGIGGDDTAVVAGFTADGALDMSFGDGGTTFVSEGFESSQLARRLGARRGVRPARPPRGCAPRRPSVGRSDPVRPARAGERGLRRPGGR